MLNLFAGRKITACASIGSTWRACLASIASALCVMACGGGDPGGTSPNGQAMTARAAALAGTPTLVPSSLQGGKISIGPTITGDIKPDAVSPLQGRTWTVGQSLETNDNSVVGHSLGIDDAGNAFSLFVKSNGRRNVLYATRGVPGAVGTPPVWSAPLPIDTDASAIATSLGAVIVAPNGGAMALWLGTGACTANTYSTSGQCNYLYTARYSIVSNAWAAPVAVADTPSSAPYLDINLNSNGDWSLLFPGWERSGASSYVSRPAVVWQAAGQTQIQKKIFNDTTFGSLGLGMDKAGNMVLFGSASQNSTTDIVAYRGTVTSGFGTQEIIDQRNAVASFERSAMGVNGQAVVMWTQNNGTSNSRFTAVLSQPAGSWKLSEIDPSSLTFGNLTWLTVADSGEIFHGRIANLACVMKFYRYVSDAWTPPQSFPSGFPCPSSTPIFNRNGDLLVLEGSGWSTYEASRNSLVRLNTATVPTIYGTLTDRSLGAYLGVLSVSGIAALAAAASYDTLPTAAQPAGDGRSSVINLWGFFLK